MTDKQKIQEDCNKAGMYVMTQMPNMYVFLVFSCIIHMDDTDNRAESFCMHRRELDRIAKRKWN